MFKLEIKTTNSAFTDNDGNPEAGFEIARILRELADRVEFSRESVGKVRDFNGNTVGEWSLTED